MHVHQYEKIWLGAALVLIVGVVATITYGTVGLGIAMVDDSEETVDPNALDDPDELPEGLEEFADPGVYEVDDGEYEVYVRAWQFGYTPGSEQFGLDPIEVPEDSEVTFYVTSEDVIHSFSLEGTNVNTMVIPGEVATMTVEFDEQDEYGVICNEYCGDGHHDMEGIVYVVPDDEFTMLELDVDEPEDVELGDEATFTVSVANDHHDERTVPVTFEIGDEAFEDELTVGSGETAEATFTVDADDLGDGDHDWTATADDLTEDGQLTVHEEIEDEEDE